MRASWVPLLFLEAAFASYLDDGCIVRGSLESKVEYGHSLKFWLRFPLEKDFRVFLPSQNVSLTRKELQIKEKTLKGWLQVELFFFEKFELRHRDQVILSGTDEIELQPPPQTIKINEARILTNCPKEVPVWQMYRDRRRTFPLEERNSFVIIFKDLPLFFQLMINSQIWNRTCDGNQNCFSKTSESSKVSIIKEEDNFKVLIDDEFIGTAPSTGNDDVSFELKTGCFYLAIPKEQESEVATNDRTPKGLLSVLGLISACLLLSLVLNATFIYYHRNRVCGVIRSTQNNNMHEASVVEDQIPAEASEGREGRTHQKPYYLPMNQHFSPGNVQNATINNSNQKVGEDSEYLYINCQEVMPSTVRNSDYIQPNEVNPFEVEILRKKNLIHGNVYTSEVAQGMKHIPQGDYVDLTEVTQEITNNVDDEESLYMNINREDEEPDYMNVPKRL